MASVKQAGKYIGLRADFQNGECQALSTLSTIRLGTYLNPLENRYPAKCINKPKSVIRRAESVFDWESEAFGHLARLCPHHAPRYAST